MLDSAFQMYTNQPTEDVVGLCPVAPAGMLHTHVCTCVHARTQTHTHTYFLAISYMPNHY